MFDPYGFVENEHPYLSFSESVCLHGTSRKVRHVVCFCVSRLQSEVTLLKQQLSDSQHLLHSLRLELQVFEKMKTDAPKSHGTKTGWFSAVFFVFSVLVNQHFFPSASAGSGEPPRNAVPSGSWDLNELLQEIRHLRLQLEKSIQTNTALREKLEEQLLAGAQRSETININYLLSSPGRPRSPRLLLTRLLVLCIY